MTPVVTMPESRPVDSSRPPYLALIAHNEMKPALVEFAREHAETLRNLPLVATGTTGELLRNQAGIDLAHSVQSGPLGGDQAIGALIATAKVRGVIFFRDPLSPHPHHADIEALGRLCDVYDVPFATNPRTALAVLWLLGSRPEDRERLGGVVDAEHPESASSRAASRVIQRYQERQAGVVGPNPPGPAPLRRV